MTIDVSYGTYATSKVVVTRNEHYHNNVLILSEDEAVELHHFLGKLLKEKGLI